MSSSVLPLPAALSDRQTSLCPAGIDCSATTGGDPSLYICSDVDDSGRGDAVIELQ